MKKDDYVLIKKETDRFLVGDMVLYCGTVQQINDITIDNNIFFYNNDWIWDKNDIEMILTKQDHPEYFL